MSELITEADISDGCNAAYLQLGHNAYFGNGFSAGVRFALERSHAPQMLEMLKRFNGMNNIARSHLPDTWLIELEQLIQQATTIK